MNPRGFADRLGSLTPHASCVHGRTKCHEKAHEAEQVLRRAQPLLERAGGGPVIGTVSVRNDPMDAIEETLVTEPIDEIMISIAPHGLSHRLHQDLPHRLKHFGLPVTAVEARPTSR